MYEDQKYLLRRVISQHGLSIVYEAHPKYVTAEHIMRYGRHKAVRDPREGWVTSQGEPVPPEKAAEYSALPETR